MQAKALDKPKKKGGSEGDGSSQLFVQNEAYDVAARAYQYVIAKGKSSYFYLDTHKERRKRQFECFLSSTYYFQKKLYQC